MKLNNTSKKKLIKNKNIKNDYKLKNKIIKDQHPAEKLSYVFPIENMWQSPDISYPGIKNLSSHLFQLSNLLLNSSESSRETKELTLRDKAIQDKRVFSNYADAVDFTPKWYYPIQLAMKDKGLRGTRLSNCTLTATGYTCGPQYARAQTIVEGNAPGWSKISKEQAIPGDYIIARNPKEGTYHTMMITGFDKYGQPLLKYSRGWHTSDSLRTNVPLAKYHELDNGGHTEDLYFRYTFPDEQFLPEVVVTPTKQKNGGKFNYLNYFK